MALLRLPDLQTRNALQICSAVFLVVGATLFHFLFFDTHRPGLHSLFVATEGVVIGTALSAGVSRGSTAGVFGALGSCWVWRPASAALQRWCRSGYVPFTPAFVWQP